MATQIKYPHMNYIIQGCNECTSFTPSYVEHSFCDLYVYLPLMTKSLLCHTNSKPQHPPTALPEGLIIKHSPPWYLLKEQFQWVQSGCQESVEMR